MGERRPHLRAARLTVAASALVVLLLGMALGSRGQAPVASRTGGTIRPSPTVAVVEPGPVEASAPELTPNLPTGGADINEVWRSAGLRDGRVVVYDNGAVVDDWGDPASQFSDTGEGAWKFIAAAADDFILPDTSDPSKPNYHITTVVAPFIFFNGDTQNVTPADWDGIYVTVYPNSGLNKPAGVPNITGGHTGSVTVSQFIPRIQLTHVLVSGPCRPCYVVTIPVDFVLAKNTRYWLSLLPDFDAPPQTAWCLSQSNTGFNAQRGASFGPPFWNVVGGNTHHCPETPPAHTKKDLAFQLLGDNVPDETGACCDDPIATCTPGVDRITCQTEGKRFQAGVTCDALDPPCGTLGACCKPHQQCEDLTEAMCLYQNGVWHEGSCTGTNPYQCPPDNDLCANAISVGDGTHGFNNRGASTDGPPPSGCTAVNQDVWFKYTATCTGSVEINLCTGTTYDSALVVYEGCACPPNLGQQLACNNDGCGGGTASKVNFAVTSGTCYLIRVGGVGTATGDGSMTITCTPPGACCDDATAQCTDGVQVTDCQGLGQRFESGVQCSQLNPPCGDEGACCDDATDTCTGEVAFADCQPPKRFQPGVPCDPFNPPCGLGACCDDALGTCTDDQTATQCIGAGKRFQVGVLCEDLDPPCGDLGACCDDATDTCTGEVAFADCQPPKRFQPGVPCDPFNPPCGLGACCDDVTGTCADNQPRSACQASGQRFSPGKLCTELIPPCGDQGACCDDTAGTCIDNELRANCQAPDQRFAPGVACTALIPRCGEGACCHANTSCNLLPASQCMLPGDSFYLGEMCGSVTCPVHDCCIGDNNGDTAIDLLDVPLFVNRLLGNEPADPGTVAFCQADIDESLVLDGNDIAPFVEMLLAGVQCAPVECCHGDINGDGTLDGLDLQDLVNALLDPPLPNTLAFCRADVDNNGSISVADDAAAMASKLVHGETCPVLQCCHGDTNGDGHLNGLDIQGLIETILDPPDLGTVEFCQADVNEDLALTIPEDVDALVDKLLNAENCPPP